MLQARATTDRPVSKLTYIFWSHGMAAVAQGSADVTADLVFATNER